MSGRLMLYKTLQLRLPPYLSGLTGPFLKANLLKHRFKEDVNPLVAIKLYLKDNEVLTVMIIYIII